MKLDALDTHGGFLGRIGDEGALRILPISIAAGSDGRGIRFLATNSGVLGEADAEGKRAVQDCGLVRDVLVILP